MKNMNPEKQWDFSKEGDQKKLNELPEKQKKRIVEESHVEANILEGKVELGEVSCYKEALKEFEQEVVDKTKEELAKEKIPQKIDLRETLKNLKVEELDYWEDRYRQNIAYYTNKKCAEYPYINQDISKLSRKKRDYLEYADDYEDYMVGYMLSGYNSLGEYDKLKINLLNYEVDRSWDVKYRLENQVIICRNTTEILETLKKYYEYEYEMEKLNYELPDYSEIEEHPEKIKEMLQIYSKFLNDEAIIVDGPEEAGEFIKKEVESGKNIVEVLKDLERRKLGDVINVPAYYTDEEALEEREKKINDNIQMARDDIKSYIKEQLYKEIIQKIWKKERDEEKQADLKMRREYVEKNYGEYLENNSENLDSKLIERIKESLVKHNNTDSHSAAYREYEMTKGLDIKDGTAVFIIEDSSLAMKASSAGWGGEEIYIKLVMVNKDKEKVFANFEIKDRFGDRKDHLEKWYSSVEIENIDKEKNEITVKLSKGDGSETSIETFSLDK